MTYKRILVACLPILLFLACTQKPSVRISGSTTVSPIISISAEEYAKTQDIQIIVSEGGSGVGINQLGEKKSDIGMSSREIKAEEKERYSQIEFKMHKIGIDAVAVCVSDHLYEKGIRAVSLQNLKKIFNGEIQNWKELGGPDIDIFCVDKEHSRGTRHVFMKKVMGDEEALAKGADIVTGANNEMQTAVANNKGGIGMLSLPWLNNGVKGLAIILEDSTVVEPNLTSVLNGTYPIIRPLLIYTSQYSSKESLDFIEFIKSSDGQKIVKNQGYVEIGG